MTNQHTKDGKIETELLNSGQLPPDLYLGKKVNVLIF